LNKERLDLATPLQPLWIVDVDRVVEGALSHGDGDLFAEVACSAPLAIATTVGNNEKVDIGIRASSPLGAGSIEPDSAQIGTQHMLQSRCQALDHPALTLGELR
jgi:hypothetical protein